MSVFRFSGRRAWVFAVVAAVACGGDRSARGGVIDDFGDPVRSPASPRRIVSLSPATTEILFALGAGPRVVGRTHWDTSPDSARLVPDLGDGIRPNVERVLAAHADLVVLYASSENRDAAQALRAAGIPVVALRIDRIADFGRATLLLGRLVGAESRAGLLVDSVTRTLDRVREATRGLPRPSVFLPAYDHPLMAIGAGSFLSELVGIAGGRNVFGDLSAPSPQISFEELLRRNPDVVLAAPATAMAIARESRWDALPAVRDGHLLVRDTMITARPGVRLGEAAMSFARLLHPGAVP